MIDNYWEERFLERAKELLDEAAENLDGPTIHRLEHMRMKALSGVDDWLERLFGEIQRS